MVTAVPGGPLMGDTLAINGLVTVKSVLVVTVPPAVVTAIGPVVAAVGTPVMIVVAVTLLIVAGTPCTNTVDVGPKLVPMMVTSVPTGPLVGVKLEIVGGGGTKTVSSVPPLIMPEVAVIVVVPVVRAEATPAVSIVATA
jgi:hypothetical protein